jgi:hypothetical protein
LHPYIWLSLIIAAIFLWQLEWIKNPGAFLWINIALGLGFIIIALSSFYDWKRDQIAQEKIAEFKLKNPEKGAKGDFKF